jgi:hypothetical protein
MLDLFSGAGSVSNVAKERGWDVVTLDISGKPDIKKDIMHWDYWLGKPGEYDFIWASPPCEKFSVCRIGRYWTKDNKPRNMHAQKALWVVERTLAVIEFYEPKYWVLENPRDKLRSLDVMKNISRHTVTYCQYDYPFMKPTDLFGNLPPSFVPRKCVPRSPCHVPAPRGSHQGIESQGLSYLERSHIPKKLVEEILISIEQA